MVISRRYLGCRFDFYGHLCKIRFCKAKMSTGCSRKNCTLLIFTIMRCNLTNFKIRIYNLQLYWPCIFLYVYFLPCRWMYGGPKRICKGSFGSILVVWRATEGRTLILLLVAAALTTPPGSSFSMLLKQTKWLSWYTIYGFFLNISWQK